jgi:hypothetical protein
VKVIDHREIFPDPSVLPVFNSHAIEACLHRIPGLAERYLYLNDDFLLGDEVAPDDFFTAAGLIKAQLSPSQFVYDGQPHDAAIPTDWASYHVRRIIEGEFGLPVRSRAKHIPYPQLRSVLEEIEERYPERLAATRAARFRSNSDLAIPSMFSLYYSIATQRGVEWPNMPREYVYADTGRADWHDRVERILDWRPKFVCLNVTRHEDIPLDVQYANVVGRENVIAGTDCGLGGRIHHQLVWAKLASLTEGAALATQQLRLRWTLDDLKRFAPAASWDNLRAALSSSWERHRARVAENMPEGHCC